MNIRIPPADEQLAILERGTVDLHPKEELKKRLAESHEHQKPLRIKTGFDPTAPDLHLGHTVLIEKMAQFQRLGHEVTFLIGDYTALIGDPTGRNAMRPPLSEEQIQVNAKTYTDQVFKILDRDRTIIEWNSKWLGKLSFQEVIKLAARYNVARMLERRDFKDRFESNTQIAIHELLYPLMQAYDSVALVPDVELGGHDQIFNLNAGRHIMEQYGQRPQCVLTVGLLVGLDGRDKMSKSKGNHVGITEPAEVMYEKILNLPDETMWTWFPLLTDRSPDPASTPALEAKKALAQTLVARFHGEAAAAEVRAWSEAGRPAKNDERTKNTKLAAIMVELQLAGSMNEARQKIKQGGVHVDEQRVTDIAFTFPSGAAFELRVGKAKPRRLKVEAE
ncbi:MAG: tyrosine--tRNA ligase [Deltaproteobacteria bacterium]|nr:tyrosine--tRNA ligase [Deltaproteobacteria bacterium]